MGYVRFATNQMLLSSGLYAREPPSTIRPYKSCVLTDMTGQDIKEPVCFGFPIWIINLGAKAQCFWIGVVARIATSPFREFQLSDTKQTAFK